MSDSVRVAVRVRPFNQREKDRNARLIIKMNGASTIITNPNNNEDKTFTFDFSYWSHDDFDTQPDGLMVPTSAKYADQKRVFNELGKDVLNNAFKGYNCSLFAYGQTGSGKSYSMVGYGVNKGIVPISFDEIFKYIASSSDPKVTYRVSLSMLEIYNEQVRDLLVPMDKNPKGGLKVRQHPQLGVQVVGLSDVPVGSYKEIEKQMDIGTHHRTVASTQMNSTSSRAHTVVAITFTQVEKDGKGPGADKETVSRINLVDLAGSERAESTGATGDRLKEGAAINLSLTMLGNVITALAEKANNPKKKVLVPYRDSKLTQILQDALGGNSKTIMIAALSPADINYEETLSTLRYADRAKQIKNKAIVNVDPMEALVQELKAENAKLLSQIKDMKAGRPVGDDGDSDEDEKDDGQSEEMRRKLEEMQQILAENQKLMENQSKTWQQKLEEARKDRMVEESRMDEEDTKKKNVPHLRNINEDPQLCNKVNHMLEEELETVGLRSANPPPSIPLSGVSIHPRHAEIKKCGDIYMLKTIGDSRVLHNGHALGVDQEVELHHGDRILFGNNHLYYLTNPHEMTAKGLPEANPTWEEAQGEIAQEQGFSIDSKKNMKEMSESERIQFLLQEDLIRVLPLINEANLIGTELKKSVIFEAKIVNRLVSGSFKPEVNVRMKNAVTDASWMWSADKFINRVFLMRELYTKFTDGENVNIPNEQDPFWDPNEPVLIGSSTVYLQSLSYMIEFDENVDIKDYKGKSEGIIRVKVLPCNAKGVIVENFGEDEDDLFVENPKELVGKRIDFIIEITHARGLNAKYTSSYCKYVFNGETHQSQTISGTTNPDFKFSKQYTFEKVDQKILDLFAKGTLQIETYGTQKEDHRAQVCMRIVENY
eukprot:TRINITY_DN5913_c0_g1_i5.p1 TRINITY_DN5913_c0_g1~~TRINITY_DN5913_c0_g1_i5.p1  ORF type:complete len:883 (-),score=215.53 TRINITY_DN5913_c0_g1_i5:75-2723(-)